MVKGKAVGKGSAATNKGTVSQGASSSSAASKEPRANGEVFGFLPVFVTPKAGADAIDGPAMGEGGPELKVRVRAVPDEGKANKAVCEVVAKELGVPKSAVSVSSGSTSRHKRLKVVGLSQEDLESRLEMLE